MANTNENTDLVPSGGNAPVAKPETLSVGLIDTVSLEGLTDDQKAMLRTKSAEALIKAQEKMAEVAVGVKAFDATLASASVHVAQMTNDGLSATVTNVQNNALGKTEIMIGNTDAARAGKMPKALRDNTLIWLGFIVLIVVIAGVLLVTMYGKK